MNTDAKRKSQFITIGERKLLYSGLVDKNFRKWARNTNENYHSMIMGWGYEVRHYDDGIVKIILPSENVILWSDIVKVSSEKDEVCIFCDEWAIYLCVRTVNGRGNVEVM